ncbi:S41 family peptidase [Fibrella aquatilis]|uniref:Tail specific protease domain-containing protein n=1 Tax=Fibrella aquatilis TaxID=2817059 RepID=A0A939GDY9_9BACT|nr:S41 family peptidase [Fibrella aquatilis]MBO0934653.1 hypothetical protein [Fibrella aquatilis]
MKRLFLAAALTLSSYALYAQTALTANEAYKYLQGERGRASRVVGDAAMVPPDSLNKAEQILNEALVYYNRPDVQALASTDIYLKARKYDILRDRTLVQLKAGRDEDALASLTESMEENKGRAWIFDDIDDNPAFARFQALPAYQKLGGSVLHRVFNSKALATTYKPNLTDAEKVAGLSKLWSEAKYNFVYFDHLPALDWDKLYLEYIPKVQATNSTVAYYRVLKQFYAQLHDGHTDVWAASPALADSVSARPPITAQLVDGRVLVQLVRHDSLQRTGLVPGLEITQVDGVPVVDYANRYVRPYQSGSTTQNVDVQTYAYNLLRGPKDRPVTIQFRDKTGKLFSRTLPRTGYGRLTPIPAFVHRTLPGNIAYVQLNTFENPEAFTKFKAAFDSISTSSALILDVRLNGGGSSGEGWNILGYLTDKPFRIGKSSSQLYSPVRRAWGEGVKFETVSAPEPTWRANGERLYTKPVVVLINGMTFSAAEDFALAFDLMKRGALIGEPTGGSTGQPLSFALPGGIMARVCTKRDTYPDGTEWVGKGIQPVVLVHPTIANVQAGRDAVLEVALNHLKTAK